MTFSKKLQAAGFFHRVDFRPSAGYRNFNTWLGDPVRALQLKVIVDTIRKEKLMENVNAAGKALMDGLQKLEVRSGSGGRSRGGGARNSMRFTRAEKLRNTARRRHCDVGQRSRLDF